MQASGIRKPRASMALLPRSRWMPSRRADLRPVTSGPKPVAPKPSTCPERIVSNTSAVHQRTDGHSMLAHPARGLRKAPRRRRRTRDTRVPCDGAGCAGERATRQERSGNEQDLRTRRKPRVLCHRHPNLRTPRHLPIEPRTDAQRRDLRYARFSAFADVPRRTSGQYGAIGRS